MGVYKERRRGRGMVFISSIYGLNLLGIKARPDQLIRIPRGPFSNNLCHPLPVLGQEGPGKAAAQ